MKKKLLFITMLFGLILIPKGVLAASLGLSCPSSVTAGENITCILTANHETISGVKGSISFSGISYQSVSNLTGSNYFSVFSNGFDGAIDIASGSKSLAKYVFTTSSAGTAIINVSCSELVDGTNFDTHSCSGASKTITIKAKETSQPLNPTPSNPTHSNPQPQQSQNNLSKNNNIKSLSVDGYELVKVDNNNYTLTVMNDVTRVSIDATAEDSKAKVTGIGAKELVVGENNIEVIVISESGAQNKINIKVTRKDGYYLEDLDSILKNNKIKDADIIINTDNKISKEAITKIKESKKTLRLNYYDENKKLLYSWSINGKEIKESKEFSTLINFTANNIEEIYKISNYADGIYIKFKHDGALPNGTKVKLYVGEKFADESIVNLYHYNKEEKLLDPIKEDLIVKGGYIEFDLEHCSDYFVTMSTISSVNDNVSSSSNIFLIIIIVAILIIIGLVTFIVIKFKTNNKNNLVNEVESIQVNQIDNFDKNEINQETITNIYDNSNVANDNNLFNNNLNEINNLNNNTENNNISNNDNINNNNLY